MTKMPVVFISKCIEHDNCRYDGNQISSPFVKELKKHVVFITECPEVAIGLSVPREAMRIIWDGQNERLVSSLTKKDMTDSMTNFSKSYVKNLKKGKMHGFILKNGSPTCDVKNVIRFDNIEDTKDSEIITSGFFGRAILDQFPKIALEDEESLRYYSVCEHFLTQIFVMCSFDEVIHNQTLSSLVNFHSVNKYLLMAYNQKNQKILGSIVANLDNQPIDHVINNYYQIFKDTLDKPSSRGSNVNMLMHLFGYFKKDLTEEEKMRFLDILEQYHKNKVPFNVPISIVNSWVIIFDEPYLKYQTIFKPYPLEILDALDLEEGDICHK